MHGENYGGGNGGLSYIIYGSWTEGCGGAGCDDSVYGVVEASAGTP